MSLRIWLPLLALGVLGSSVRSRPAVAQGGRPDTPASRAIEVSAEDLGKAFAPDTLEPLKTYEGKTLRIVGRVSMAHDPFVYLATGSKFPTGQPVLITLDTKAGGLPGVAVGDRLTVEGKLDRKEIFGPVLTDIRLVRRDQPPKAAPVPRVSVKKAPTSRKAGVQPGSVDPSTADPQAITLQFDGQIHEGEPGYRPNSTSFRLRLGPGTWKGTVVGRSVAWGDGNGGNDHWGVGSGEATHSSEVQADARGAYFTFSINGDDWESGRIGVLFRLTLPDGRPGVATVVIRVDKDA